MTQDENQAPDNQQTGETTPSVDDSRFEVKWRKKSQTSSPPVSEVETEGEENFVEPDDLQAQLDAERQRAKDLHDRWQRAMADLANLRKRTEQEQADREKFASMRLISELLPALDNFDRALQSLPRTLGPGLLSWFQGLLYIEQQQRSILYQQGLAPIETEGQAFNPQFHEAISERETNDAAPGAIVGEFQRGYSMHGFVLRPALVEVAAAPAESTPASTAGDNSLDVTETQPVSEETAAENANP